MKSKMKDTNDKENKDQKPQQDTQEQTKKRYFLFWDVDTIVVNNQPMTVTFPLEK
jgi:hypothetical protein